MKSKTNRHLGSDFDAFLKNEGIDQEVEAAAVKKVIAATLVRQMMRRNITVSALAATLGTSRAAVNRVLDERNTSITLTTLSRAAAALGCRLRLEIVPS